MMRLAKWFGMMALAGLTLTGVASPVEAQVRIRPGPIGFAGPPINRNWLVAPGLNIRQAAYNTAVTARALSYIPPYLLGYNPYPQAINYGPMYNAATPLYSPVVNPYVNPYAGGLGTPYSSLYSSPTLGGYGGGAGVSSLTSYGGLPATSPVDAGGYGGAGYSPYSGVSDPYSGFLRGTADVINAQGKLEKDLQKSRVISQYANQARIDTRRKLFDEIMYERAHTPSLNDIREKQVAHAYRRAQLTAPVTEVWSGKSLNDLLGNLTRLHKSKVFGPNIELDADILKQINIRGAGPGSGNIGVLRNEGRLSWPIGLRDLKPADQAREIRSFLETKALKAVAEAANGKVSTGVIKDLRSKVKELHQLLRRNLNDDLGTNEYIEAKRYLNNFDEAIDTLARPNAANYFNQTYMAKGKTIKDLIGYMADKGLVFAPAVSGDESAYQALHQALAAYSLSTDKEMKTDNSKEKEKE